MACGRGRGLGARQGQGAGAGGGDIGAAAASEGAGGAAAGLGSGVTLGGEEETRYIKSLTFAQLVKLPVSELKAYCAVRSLKTGGNRKEMAERLIEFFKSCAGTLKRKRATPQQQ